MLDDVLSQASTKEAQENNERGLFSISLSFFLSFFLSFYLFNIHLESHIQFDIHCNVLWFFFFFSSFRPVSRPILLFGYSKSVQFHSTFFFH